MILMLVELLFSVEYICPFFVPGVDKENVQLSPSSALSSGGRIRHGSASQVQKQRSAGSFKRPSIKKIVWLLLQFELPGFMLRSQFTL